MDCPPGRVPGANTRWRAGRDDDLARAAGLRRLHYIADRWQLLYATPPAAGDT